MSKLTAAGLAACALGLALSACSLAGPSPRTFTAAEPTAATPDPAVIDAASKACKETARDKGFKSVLGILSRLLPRAVDADYVACMKSKGYDVAK